MILIVRNTIFEVLISYCFFGTAIYVAVLCILISKKNLLNDDEKIVKEEGVL